MVSEKYVEKTLPERRIKRSLTRHIKPPTSQLPLLLLLLLVSHLYIYPISLYPRVIPLLKKSLISIHICAISLFLLSHQMTKYGKAT